MMVPVQRKTNIAWYVYTIVVLLDLLFIYLNKSHERWFTKPFLMPLLLLGCHVSGIQRNNKSFFLIAGALLLSWGGDVLLQMEGLFIPGLISFLLAHLFYIIWLTNTGKEKKGLIQQHPVIALAVIVYILIFLWLLFPYLNSFKIPVTVYSVTIGSMLLLALNTKQKLPEKTSTLLTTGAILFVISDSVLAVNLFAYKHMLLSLTVMSTYAAAQFLIVRGALSLQET